MLIIGLNPFQVDYGYNSQASINLALVSDLFRKSSKEKTLYSDFKIFIMLQTSLLKAIEGYKVKVNRKRQALKFIVMILFRLS